MTRIAGAEWHPLKENATEPHITATQLIFHSAVSKADSLWAYFQRDNIVLESHLYVDHLGHIEQYIDLDRQADANYKANVRAISVETWDNGDPNHVPWNDAQMKALVNIAVQVHRLKHVPIVQAPAWDKPGMGGHTDYPNDWTNVRGKTCPGLARRPQVAVILNRAKAIVDGHTTITSHPSSTSTGTKAPSFPLPPGHWYGPASGGGKAHDHGDGLKIWQAHMAKRGWKIHPDGSYGNETGDVAEAFQREKHLVPDRLIGLASWNAAWTTAVTK